jgi:hypothetical protein
MATWNMPKVTTRQMRCLPASRKLNPRIARVPQAEVRVAYAQRTSPRRLQIGGMAPLASGRHFLAQEVHLLLGIKCPS